MGFLWYVCGDSCHIMSTNDYIRRLYCTSKKTAKFLLKGLSSLFYRFIPLPQTRDQDLLDRLTATIVDEFGEVGVFKYNKFAYLFEFFFIKNFGERYTKESFIKLPKGPVISGYKSQIRGLMLKGLVKADLSLLDETRELGANSGTIPIEHNSLTHTHLLQDEAALELLRQIIRKYGSLTDTQLGELVYKTDPVIKYLELCAMGIKRETGGRILDNVTLKDYKTAVVKGRMIARKHLAKYPTAAKPDPKVAEEMEFFTRLKLR